MTPNNALCLLARDGFRGRALFSSTILSRFLTVAEDGRDANRARYLLGGREGEGGEAAEALGAALEAEELGALEYDVSLVNAFSDAATFTDDRVATDDVVLFTGSLKITAGILAGEGGAALPVAGEGATLVLDLCAHAEEHTHLTIGRAAVTGVGKLGEQGVVDTATVDAHAEIVALGEVNGGDGGVHVDIRSVVTRYARHLVTRGVVASEHLRRLVFVGIRHAAQCIVASATALASALANAAANTGGSAQTSACNTRLVFRGVSVSHILN